MQQFDLKEMFQAQGVDPQIMSRIAMALSGTDHKAVFNDLAKILDDNGITRQNRELRMPG